MGRRRLGLAAGVSIDHEKIPDLLNILVQLLRFFAQTIGYLLTFISICSGCHEQIIHLLHPKISYFLRSFQDFPFPGVPLKGAFVVSESRFRLKPVRWPLTAAVDDADGGPWPPSYAEQFDPRHPILGQLG